MGPLQGIAWLYREFGIQSVWATGRDAWFIILARSFRMFAYGTTVLILALFFAELNFTDTQIGLFMTFTMAGDVVLGTLLTIVADRIGRRKIILGGSILMILSGMIFALFENFWILLFAAVVGVISVSGGDFGPFRAIEESMLSQITTADTRNDVLSWYVTAASLGSCVGTEASGRIIQFLIEKWSTIDAYHCTFWIYSAMGLVNFGFVLCLSDNCEAREYTPVAEEETEEQEHFLGETGEPKVSSDDIRVKEAPKKKSQWAIRALFADISIETRHIMYKLWFLLGIDTLADGMVPYTLTNYYIDRKFHLPKSTLGDITAVSYFLASLSTIFAAPLARRIGLLNTMVFTHVPSSASVLFFPLPSSLWMTVLLLFIRTGLNNMDQAPRSAFIAAAVKPHERTAVLGITSMIRTLTGTCGPTLTGIFAGNDSFWIAFVAAGILRLGYDFGLWAMFVNLKLHQHEENKGDGDAAGVRRKGDEEEVREMKEMNKK
ncbi:MFS general substrate transporter [Microthyrium microscopicum]|uniref:MFS general substrate transporter n=1 Tax=Microthyrium microscopicum TaxID=703497 RepID=A0A6A6TVH4_9PEZI|nr:MFS general substrate transporter [Microthyrium microscopicum]